MRKVYLFTLHETEKDLEIKAALLAESPSEAAGFWGGQYEQFKDSNRDDHGHGERRRFEEGRCVCASKLESLGLCGTVTFAPVLFREPTSFEHGMLGWDSGPFYQRAGLALHNVRPPQPISLIMRRHYMEIPSSVFDMLAFEKMEIRESA